MPSHFYVSLSRSPDVGDVLNLDRDQHHYLTRVLRLKSGEAVPCFDGAGLKFQAVLHVERKSATLEVSQVSPRKTTTTPQNHVALALLKGGAMDRAIQLACESGADEISLFKADRSNVSLSTDRYESKIRHWQKIIVGACEQSGRLFVPAFTPTTDLDALLSKEATTYVLDMEGGPFNLMAAADRLLFVGPEGGWSDKELEQFRLARAQRVSVGPNTLRAESAPGAALAILSYLDSSS